MGYSVQKSSKEAVFSWYMNQDEAPFRIYRGMKESEGTFCDAYTGKDKEEGAMVLQKALVEMEPTDYNIYFLKLYNSNPKTKTPAPGITFSVNQPQSSIAGPGYQPAQYQAMNEILSEIRALRAERMAEIEEDDEEEEEETPAEESLIAGIMKEPEMKTMIMGLVANIAGSFMKPGPIKALAGIDESSIEESIKLLLSKGVTAQDIAKLASMEQNQINFLLSMLRK
jgi:hypothetical protein